jgi:hypothetical protein
MDFRKHWLAHFRAIVDKEIAARGDAASAYKAVGAALEKGDQTIYQHYKQKSGKVYPTVEMMVSIEKKYGNGRPPGWSSLPLAEINAAPLRPWPLPNISWEKFTSLTPSQLDQIEGAIMLMMIKLEAGGRGESDPLAIIPPEETTKEGISHGQVIGIQAKREAAPKSRANKQPGAHSGSGKNR